MNRGRGQFCSKQRQLFRFLSGVKRFVIILIDYDIHPENGVEINAKYVEECYANGANFYIKKPANLQETKIKIGAFFKYWMEVVEVV